MNINEPDNGGLFSLPFHNEKENPNLKERDGARNHRRIPFLSWMNDDIRNHFIAMSGEFAGTCLFLFFAFSGTQVALIGNVAQESVVGAPSNPAQLLYVALCFGFSLAVNAWVFFRISGGLFNPAVTLGMCLVGALPYFRGLLLTVSQIMGGIAAAAIVSALFPGPLTVVSKLGGGTSIVQGLFIEMFLTAQLVFTIFMLAAEKHKGTFIAPIGIGLSLFIAELTGVYYTGGSVNPARSFGPSVVDHSFPGYHWIYWVGPILGSLVASGFFKYIKMLEYETANPGQDSHEAPPRPPMSSRSRFSSRSHISDEKRRVQAEARHASDAEARHASDTADTTFNNTRRNTNQSEQLGVLPPAKRNQGLAGDERDHRRIGSDDTLAATHGLGDRSAQGSRVNDASTVGTARSEDNLPVMK